MCPSCRVTTEQQLSKYVKMVLQCSSGCSIYLWFFYIHLFLRPFEVILASGFTLCYCAMAVQQLPLQESFSLSIGAMGLILMI